MISIMVGTAASFVKSLGVNVHLNYGDTAYAESQTVLNAVAYLGFTRVRDHTPSLDAASIAPYALLAKQGITFDLDLPSGAVDLKAAIGLLDGFAAKFPGALAAVEGSNEVNLWPVSFNGLSGLPAAAALQKAFYAAVKADALLQKIPVFNTTLGGASQAQYAQLGTLSAYCDYGNTHIYPQGTQTPNDYIAANVTWSTPDTPGKPTVITEGGYFTMPGVAAWEGVSPDVQARYTLDYVLDAAAQGIPATYLYELLDERPDAGNTDREQHFGLFYNNGAPKPAATALHNLTTILADPNDSAATGAGAAFTVSKLPSSGHVIEMTKANGASDIVVWAEPSLWDQATASAVAAPVCNVAVNLASTAAAVAVYDPMLGTAPVSQLTNANAVNLALTDHPLIVEVGPAPAAGSSLVLRVSEDAWQGDAQFTVTVDSVRVGGVFTASASHTAGLTQEVALPGTWSTGTHTVGLSFINDAWGGTASTDRNLYVDSIAFGGTTYASTSAALYSNGSVARTVGGTTTVGAAPADRLTLHVSEDAWQGDALFTVSIDGRQVAAPMAVTASHGAGQSQDFTFDGAFGAGTHRVGVSFINDAWGGTASTDRNLYLGGIDINGAPISNGAAALMSNGTQQFAITTVA